MPDLLDMSRSKASMATATKENVSLAKEVFNGRPLDYSVMSYVMIYEILKSCDMNSKIRYILTSVRTYAKIFF